MLKRCIQQLLDFFYPVVKRLMPFSVYAYLVVGAANTVLNIGLFVLFMYVFSGTLLALEVSTVISFVFTVVTGFWLNRNFAFSGSGERCSETQQQFGRYALVALQGQFSAYVLTKVMTVLLSVNASVAYFVTTVIMLTLNYFLQKYFTFRKSRAAVS